MKELKLAVIIPCYNEALSIGKVVDDFKKHYRRLLCMFMIIIQQMRQLKLPVSMVQSSEANRCKVKEMSFAGCLPTLRLMFM